MIDKQASGEGSHPARVPCKTILAIAAFLATLALCALAWIARLRLPEIAPCKI